MSLASLLRRFRIAGWRRRVNVYGLPDFVFPQRRVALFVDGCFWHGCPKHYTRPKTRRAFWDRKFRENRARDRKVGRVLRSKGWRVVRVWEHDLETARGTAAVIARIKRGLSKKPL